MGLNVTQTMSELEKAEAELTAAHAKVLQLRRAMPALSVQDYQLVGLDGNSTRLSALFRDQDELMIIHNMGKQCSYCTLWADGFNGVWRHLNNRVPFAVVTPDPLQTVQEFSASRGWTFPIFSSHGTSFFKDLGFADEKDSPFPGVSVFRRDADGSVYRTAYDFFGPGDPYCSVWHLLDLLPKGENGWQPKYTY